MRRVKEEEIREKGINWLVNDVKSFYISVNIYSPTTIIKEILATNLFLYKVAVSRTSDKTDDTWYFKLKNKT